eukprot:m.222094 g.222094  ORF g.222094 m.222094 type:complete len:65 (-) comp15621_c1_seq2:804-998(-)
MTHLFGRSIMRSDLHKIFSALKEQQKLCCSPPDGIEPPTPERQRVSNSYCDLRRWLDCNNATDR